MGKSGHETLKVRILKSDDFESLVKLDSKLRGGENRKDYWEKKFAIFRMRHPNLSLVATVEDTVVGYVMGNISGWEFGVPAGIGWVELIGVDTEHRREGVARALIEELFRQFDTLDVTRVYTMIDMNNFDMRDFFKLVGFRQGQMVHLEKDLHSD